MATDNMTPEEVAEEERVMAQMYAKHATEGCDDPCLVPDEAHNDTESARLSRSIDRAIKAARWAAVCHLHDLLDGKLHRCLETFQPELDRLRRSYEETRDGE